MHSKFAGTFAEEQELS